MHLKYDFKLIFMTSELTISPSSLFPFLTNYAPDPHNLLDFLVDKRSLVLFLPTNIVPNRTQNHHPASDNDRIIHRGRSDRCRRRPNRPEDHEDHV